MKDVSDAKALALSTASKRAAMAVGDNAFDATHSETDWRDDLENFLSSLSMTKIAEFTTLMEDAYRAKIRNSFKQ